MEVSLGMGANGADFRRFFADDDMAAVGALPNGVSLSREYQAAFDVGDQFAVAGFVFFFDFAYFFK